MGKSERKRSMVPENGPELGARSVRVLKIGIITIANRAIVIAPIIDPNASSVFDILTDCKR
ncbi:hypothetical protein [Halobaculum roseum]|uniref:hypothetical protein n=1 Tax=Halobaculum roseum TaxID=2175149 RepID=UPI00336FEE44